MNRNAFLAVATLLIAGTLAGCGGPKRQTYMLPPRVDLKAHETLGIVQFDAPSEEDLARMATQRFTDSARRDQGMVRIIGFGASNELLRSVGFRDWTPEAIQAIGRERGVRTLITGELKISETRPSVKVSPSALSGNLSALIDATLSVQIVETETGASLWSSSAHATRQVGHVGVSGGKYVSLGVEDPEQAYGSLIDSLIEQVTRDFRVSWERR